MANARNRMNHIHFIEEDGRRLTPKLDKSEYFYCQFKKSFTPECRSPSTFGDWSEVFKDGSWLGEDHLTIPFTEIEIKKATFQLGADKAPGPDGFSMVFFQRFWEMIKSDLLKNFDDLFVGVLNSGPIDYSHICLACS